jgi:hypothetical protein
VRVMRRMLALDMPKSRANPCRTKGSTMREKEIVRYPRL